MTEINMPHHLDTLDLMGLYSLRAEIIRRIETKEMDDKMIVWRVIKGDWITGWFSTYAKAVEHVYEKMKAEDDDLHDCVLIKEMRIPFSDQSHYNIDGCEE